MKFSPDFPIPPLLVPQGVAWLFPCGPGLFPSHQLKATPFNQDPSFSVSALAYRSFRTAGFPRLPPAWITREKREASKDLMINHFSRDVSPPGDISLAFPHPESPLYVPYEVSGFLDKELFFPLM